MLTTDAPPCTNCGTIAILALKPIRADEISAGALISRTGEWLCPNCSHRFAWTPETMPSAVRAVQAIPAADATTEPCGCGS